MADTEDNPSHHPTRPHHYYHHSPHSVVSPPPPPQTQTRECVALDLLADAATAAASNSSSPVLAPTSAPPQAAKTAHESNSQSHPALPSQPPQGQLPKPSAAYHHPFPQSYPRLPPPFPSNPSFPSHFSPCSDFISTHPHSAPPPSAFDFPFPHPTPLQQSALQYSQHRFSNNFPSPMTSNVNTASAPMPMAISSPSHSSGQAWPTSRFGTMSSIRPRSLSCGADLDKHAKGSIPLPPPAVEPNAWRLPPLIYPSSNTASPNLSGSPPMPSYSRRPMYQYVAPNGTINSTGGRSQTPTTKPGRRTSYLRFTQEEENMLEDGVRVFGSGNWKRILHSYRFHPKRSPVDLKDKWRNLNRSKAKKAAARLSSVASNPDLHVLSTSDVSESSSSLKAPSSLDALPKTNPLSQSPPSTPSVSMALPPLRPQSNTFARRIGAAMSADQMEGTTNDSDDTMMSCEPRSM